LSWRIRASRNQIRAEIRGVGTLGQSYRHLAPTGRLLIYGFASMLPHDGKVN
jgi:synaptic vesicle membrane protein VAT-1